MQTYISFFKLVLIHVLYLLAAEMILCPQIHKIIAESVYLIQA